MPYIPCRKYKTVLHHIFYVLGKKQRYDKGQNLEFQVDTYLCVYYSEDKIFLDSFTVIYILLYISLPLNKSAFMSLQRSRSGHLNIVGF